MRRLIICLCLPLAVAACGAQPRWAPDEEVARARYVHSGPPELTLFTVIDKSSGAGAHSALMINGTERLMFDPAGSWYLPSLAERNDVHRGMTDRMVAFYIDYHARESYDVIEQRLVVTPEQALRAQELALNYGAVPRAHCAQSISSILRKVPGFEKIPATYGPKVLSRAFGKYPGVKSRTITDTDADDNHGVLMIQLDDPRAAEIMAKNAARDAANTAALEAATTE